MSINKLHLISKCSTVTFAGNKLLKFSSMRQLTSRCLDDGTLLNVKLNFGIGSSFAYRQAQKLLIHSTRKEIQQYFTILSLNNSLKITIYMINYASHMRWSINGIY